MTPVLGFYESMGKLKKIDGEKEPDQVKEAVLKSIRY